MKRDLMFPELPRWIQSDDPDMVIGDEVYLTNRGVIKIQRPSGFDDVDLMLVGHVTRIDIDGGIVYMLLR